MNNKKLKNRAEKLFFGGENIVFHMKACMIIVGINYRGKFKARGHGIVEGRDDVRDLKFKYEVSSCLKFLNL